MDLFDVLTLLGGLSLFLFGMNLMGASLEKRAGSSLKILLGKLTSRTRDCLPCGRPSVSLWAPMWAPR